MDHIDGSELPPAVHEGPFSYSRRGFYFSAEPYVQRHAGQDLKEILNKPIETKSQRATIKPLIKAHLAFYGVQSNHDQRWRANLELLKNAAEAGQVRILSIPPGTYLTATNSKCESLSSNVLEIHCRLADQYNALTAKFLCHCSDKLQERFRKASSKTVEANLDQDRFLGKHFRDILRKAGQGRRKKPMILIGLNNVNELIKAAQTLDLKTTPVLEGGRAILVVGGSEDKNVELGSTLEHNMGKDKHSPKDMLNPSILAKHIEVHSSSRVSDPILQRAKGRYIIESKDVEIQGQAWKHRDLKTMFLQISKNHYDGWIAQFELCSLRGVMILDTDVHRLNARWMKSKTGSCRVREWESDAESGDSDSGDEVPACGESHNGSKHAPPSYKVRFYVNGARQQFRPPTSSTGGSSRHVKPAKADGNGTIYFRWLSKEPPWAENSGIETDPSDGQKGALKFLNEECTVFEGSISGSWLGEDISFQCFKYSHETDSYF